jgi:DNA polymerase III subunit gamma/tau
MTSRQKRVPLRERIQLPDDIAGEALPLHLKHRPRTLDGIVGHDDVLRVLRGAFKTGRYPQATFLAGLPGVGKTTLARIIARCFNCDNGGPTPNPCGVCNFCRSYDRGERLGQEEFPASRLNERAALRDFFLGFTFGIFRPNSKYTVVVVEDIDLLQKTAIAELLKWVEEPPSYVKFVLTSTEPWKVPDALKSRCIQMNLKPVHRVVLANYLGKIAQREGTTIDDSTLNSIARESGGSVRNALTQLESELARRNVSSQWRKES